jgi:hypothetical protein
MLRIPLPLTHSMLRIPLPLTRSMLRIPLPLTHSTLRVSLPLPAGGERVGVRGDAMLRIPLPLPARGERVGVRGNQRHQEFIRRNVACVRVDAVNGAGERRRNEVADPPHAQMEYRRIRDARELLERDVRDACHQIYRRCSG